MPLVIFITLLLAVLYVIVALLPHLVESTFVSKTVGTLVRWPMLQERPVNRTYDDEDEDRYTSYIACVSNTGDKDGDNWYYAYQAGRSECIGWFWCEFQP
eukprot:Nk52_evm3s2657 gene=Nk52_evmTU3s2657